MGQGVILSDKFCRRYTRFSLTVQIVSVVAGVVLYFFGFSAP